LKNFKVLDRAKAIGQMPDLSIRENSMILAVYLAITDINNRRRSMKITETVRASKDNGR